MKNCKLYWISLATTMLFASGCGDAISTEEVPSNPPGTTECTNGTWKCDDNVLSKCIAGKWDKFKMCGNNAICNDKTGTCTKMNGETKCRNTEHLFAGRCEPDDLNHCGTHTNDCTKTSGWKSGDCIDKQCYASKCAAGYHLVSFIDANGNEKTICKQDTHDACGNEMVNCGSEIEPICMSNDQLKSDAMHCGSCDNKCNGNELCQDGQCVVNTCSENACFYENACINLNDHCGTQCLNCNTANNALTGFCQDGACIPLACVDGYHIYENACEADTLEHCGAHGNACNVENGTNICNKGKCDFECFDGFDNNGACEMRPQFILVWKRRLEPQGKYTDDVCIPIGKRSSSIKICWGTSTPPGKEPCTTIESKNAAKYYCHHYDDGSDESTITITGEIDDWSCRAGNLISYCNGYISDANKFNGYLKKIESYGEVKFGNYAFYQTRLEGLPPDESPKFSNNSMKGAFAYSNFNQDINHWDTSYITDMSEMFYYATYFNRPLNNWNTSNVTNMGGMFEGAQRFNQPLNDWDTLSVTNMSEMFYGADSFNQPLNDWDTSNVTNMSGMFGSSSFIYPSGSSSFNYPLDKWDTSNVTDMSRMFYRAKSFNQPLNDWDTSNVTNMSEMFRGAESFNGDIDNWNTANVKDMGNMFAMDTKYIEERPYIVSAYTIFNKPINSWNTSNVTNMSGMFSDAHSFNQPLNNWDISNVTNMNGMFTNAYSFNQPLNDWNTSNVTHMSSVFWGAKRFNQPLNDWDTSNVTDMSNMFYFAHSFNQLLDKWDISKVSNIFNIFDKSGMTRDNYCKLFKGEYGAYWKKWKNLGIYFNCD